MGAKAVTGSPRARPTAVVFDLDGTEVSQPKPALQGLRLACQGLGVDTAETAYVGDAEVDLQCAQAAGALAIHACWGASPTAARDVPLVARRPSDIAELLGMLGPPRAALNG